MNPPNQPSEKYIREHSPSLNDIIFTRRQFLQRTGMGFGAMSLAGVFGINPWAEGASALNPGGLKIAGPLAPKSPHFPAKAKHIIHLFASGAPTQVDTWDPKPELTKYDGKTIPGHDGVAFGSKVHRSFAAARRHLERVLVRVQIPEITDVRSRRILRRVC